MSHAKSYEGEGIRVSYDPQRCIHAAQCVRGLPEVFDPDRKPWIDSDAAPPDVVAAVVRRCPTGALTYERLDGGSRETAPAPSELRVAPGGPVYASGDIVILDADHRELTRQTRIAFCRCGSSRNKPFCDGRHADAEFDDPGTVETPTIRPPAPEDPRTLSVRLRRNGPLVLAGRFRIVDAEGRAVDGASGALCRCGASKRKPFCDGTHREIGFAAEDPVAD